MKMGCSPLPVRPDLPGQRPSARQHPQTRHPGKAAVYGPEIHRQRHPYGDHAPGKDHRSEVFGPVVHWLRDFRSVVMGVALMPTPTGNSTRAEPGGPGSADLLSWLTDRSARHSLEVSRVPLAEVPNWITNGTSIRPVRGGGFSIVGVDVRAGTREVASWSQPLAPSAQGSKIAEIISPGVGVCPAIL